MSEKDVTNYPISLDHSPPKQQTFSVKPTLAHTKKLVNELMKYVDENNLSVNIAGKKYLQVEAWQFTGSQLNLTAIVTDIQDITRTDDSGKTTPKYKATVEVIHNPTGQLVSRGFALCSKDESKKKGFDEYAVASMAQTRAIGKAYRNILAWLPKLAGYEGTPAEEITENLRETMADELATKKQQIVKLMREQGITDSVSMIGTIQQAIGKDVIEDTDDANRVIGFLNETES